MKQEIGIKLQAYLDGELSPRDAREVTVLIEKDAEARALYAELQQTSLALKANELERRLPESREFFWSKIEREIERLDAQPASPATPWWLAFLRRNLAAVSGVGVATALLVLGAFQMNWVSPDQLEVIDNPLDDSSSLSFRSESQKMTVVWISDSSATATDEESDSADETVQ
jgi:anti-sigma factor RsiW